MKKQKVLFYLGYVVDNNTFFEDGFIFFEDGNIFLECKGVKTLLEIVNISSVNLVRFGLLSLIEIKTKILHIYITVPRLFINLGTGFVVVNYFRTKQLFRKLKENS